MLAELLASFEKLSRPTQCETFFVVVENDREPTSRPVFERFEATLGPERAYYFLEPRRGIPIARNRALDEAVALGADLGAFIDDDELADSEWLVQLINCYSHRALTLVGGPIRPIAWHGENTLTRHQKTILDGVKWRYSRKELRSARIAKRGKDGDIVVVTNNWMIDLHWWSTSGLRFDESLHSSGGSDALFYSQAVRLGAKSGWCPSAIVFESTPIHRLTFAYQFRRARDQANAAFYRKYSPRSAKAISTTLISIGLKAVGATACLLMVPLAGGPAIVQGARSLGWIAGRLKALKGGLSQFYLNVDGG